MPRTRRHFVTKCRSTPNEQNMSSVGTFQNEDVHLPQSEPIAHVGSTSQDEIHAVSVTQSESRRSPHREPDLAEDSSTTQKKSPTYWNVDVINEEGVVRHTRLRVQDVFATHDATRVCTKWNAEGQPIGESAGLLAWFLGEIASNFNNFPIMYETWKKVPNDYKNNVYKETIKANFDVNDHEHKKFILSSLGKKWRDTRSRMFHKNYNWEISVEENCRKHPPEIDPDHWRFFVQFRTSPKQMEISDKNAANREKLLIPHTLGSKTLARKRDELESQYGRQYSRGDMYPIAHKKKDGSFVNKDAREKCEQLHNEIQETSSENEAFIKVFGKEHPGYVRGMGLGVTPTQIIGSCSSSMRSGSPSDAATIAKLESEIEMLKTRVGEVDVLKEQLAFLMQTVKGNQAADLESPRDLRRSSQSSHVPKDNGGSSQGAI
ncbi:putative transposase, Ptta/En/Spm, plant [Sesbania bispinosa]|nr:putative transposase, Ptta/En/Spm, plant [Sesbania bispinosa]